MATPVPHPRVDLWHDNRPALLAAGCLGSLAKLLVLTSPVYATWLHGHLWTGLGDEPALLAPILIGLYAAYVALTFRQRLVLMQAWASNGPFLQSAFDALWLPAQLLVLAALHPVLAALALTGLSALAALAAAGDLSDGAAPERSGGGTGMVAMGLTVCCGVYQALSIGTAIGLWLHGLLSPGEAIGAAIIAANAMHACHRTATLWSERSSKCAAANLLVLRPRSGAVPKTKPTMR